MPAGAYVYNPPAIAPVGNGGSPAPVQHGATVYQPAVYQQMPPLSQPGQMLYSPPVVGPYVAGSAGPSSSASPGLSASTTRSAVDRACQDPQRRSVELRKIHDQLVSSAALRECTLPDFPPAPWFTDHTKPEHMARRKKELVRYFNALLKEPKVLVLPKFHMLMELATDAAEAMRAVGNHILDARMERQRAEQERKRQVEAERQRKMREAYNHAQTFHRNDHYQVWYNGAQMTSTRALTYNEHTAFNLREKFWGFGDATIQGPNGQPWFQISKINRSLFHFHDCQYAILNMQGEPLILLQECWKFMSLKFKIYSILTDECGQRRQHMFKMCSIKRTSIFGIVEYVIRMATPSTARDCRPCRKSLIKCDGSWGDWNTSFSVGRYETARVSRNFAFMTTGDYDIHVSPGQDVILYLALAVCIDKMHYEATRK
ncbi:uncharacterized protein ACA1_236630 [Acanthamoeba castellanii str. Neff]|uniref:PX domain-containing protein n=1 Tax=Acanthamoeba castellanii (strain ATCC 30010 / Neff) TaxID=1257118 RepID=L8H1G0_ACACF|nr:uncharacterized protein ACA1_236630 [Acanthamoeba castellanii str. Neff]ELR19075.1 hypothetical protein ACA1_236630 [Acanthamoeba castellanii str. Neff]